MQSKYKIGTLRIYFYDNVQVLIKIDEKIDILIHLILISRFFNIYSRGFTVELIPEFLQATCTAFRIRHCGNFSRTNQATSTKLYITTRKNAFDRAEVLKTFETQHYIGFFVIAGLLEFFTAYVRPADIRPAMRYY